MVGGTSSFERPDIGLSARGASRLPSLVFLIILALFALAPQLAKAKEIPMWEGVQKTEEQKAADAALIAGVLAKTKGNPDIGADRAIQLGWEFIAKSDWENAIRRFNQAWLLSPGRGEIYWGFAVAGASRGDKIDDVDRYFEKAHSIIGEQSRLYSDWGRICEAQGRLQQARTYFEKAIQLDPNNPEPHIGMTRIGIKTGDGEMVRKHQTILKRLKRNAA